MTWLIIVVFPPIDRLEFFVRLKQVIDYSSEVSADPLIYSSDIEHGLLFCFDTFHGVCHRVTD